MKKHITFLTILKHLITAHDIASILKKHNYVDIARKFTVSSLLDFLAIASVHQWKSFRTGGDIATSYGLSACDYSTLSW